jgi:hypothetical protein
MVLGQVCSPLPPLSCVLLPSPVAFALPIQLVPTAVLLAQAQPNRCYSQVSWAAEQTARGPSRKIAALTGDRGPPRHGCLCLELSQPILSIHSQQPPIRRNGIHTTCPSFESLAPPPPPPLPLLVRLFSGCQPPLATLLNLSMSVLAEESGVSVGVVNVPAVSGTDACGPMRSSAKRALSPCQVKPALRSD